MANAADKLIAELEGLQNSEALLKDFSLAPAIAQARALGAIISSMRDALEQARDELAVWDETEGGDDEGTADALAAANEALDDAEELWQPDCK